MQFRRTSLRLKAATAAVAASALLLSGCAAGGDASASGDSKQPLVVGSWGGYFDTALKEAYFDDFTQETGIEVVLAPADQARFSAMNEAKSSEWNTVDGGAAVMGGWAEKQYLLPLPEKAAKSDLVQEPVSNYGAGAYLNSYVIVYRPSAFSEPVQTWKDVWDVKKFPGKRAMVGFHEGMAEAALLADGVAPDKLYPLDLDRGFAKLSELKPNLFITEGYAELRQAIQTKQVDLAIMPSGSAAQSVLATNGELKVSWDQNIITEAGFAMSAYGPNKEGAEKLAEFMQDPKRQAEFTDKSYYGSAMSSALEHVDPKVRPLIPSNPDNLAKSVRSDNAWYAQNNDEYVNRFSEWLTK